MNSVRYLWDSIQKYAAFTTEKDINTMRSSELKNFLIQKMKVDYATVSKIIDRQELKELAIHYQTIALSDLQKEILLLSCVQAVILAGIVFFVLKFMRQILAFLKSLVLEIYLYLKNSLRFPYKMKLIQSNMQKWLLYRAALIIISWFIEVLVLYLNITTFLGWFINGRSFLRKFFLPTLSVPINPTMNFGSSSNQGQVSESGLTIRIL
jgi:hypothetical protein